jgi:hypothetical protein
MGEALMAKHAKPDGYNPAPRRSSRIAEKPSISYAPKKSLAIPQKRYEFAEQDTSVNYPTSPWPIYSLCYKKHPGLGCAARSANHSPKYYSPADKPAKVIYQFLTFAINLFTQPVFFQDCPYCGGNHLNDTEDPNSAKCCAGGKVELMVLYNELQDRPIQLEQLLTIQDHRWSTKHFKKNVLTYNRLHAFGALHITKEGVGRGVQVVKINGDIRYMLSDIRLPKPNAKARAPLFAQRYFLDPDQAIQNRLNDKTVEGKRISENILMMLDQMLRFNHPLVDAYRTANRVYWDKYCQCEYDKEPMPRFRMVIFERRKAIEAGANPAPQVHPHRTLLPTKDGKHQIGEIFFDPTAGGEARVSEPGIILTAKEGGRVTMVYWDPNIDNAIFPLLFSMGQLGKIYIWNFNLTNI